MHSHPVVLPTAAACRISQQSLPRTAPCLEQQQTQQLQHHIRWLQMVQTSASLLLRLLQLMSFVEKTQRQLLRIVLSRVSSGVAC
jgi:hypothetical protein